MTRDVPISNHRASKYTPGIFPASEKPTPNSNMDRQNTAMLCDADAMTNPTSSRTQPRNRVVRPPHRFKHTAGKGLDKPQASPRSEKLKPAAVMVQCNSATMV